MIKISACVMCKHLTSERGEKPKCAAFPNGIPKEIVKGDNYHLSPVEGDGGILYEPKSEDQDFRKIFKVGE